MTQILKLKCNVEVIEEVTTMKLKKAWNRRLYQSTIFPSFPIIQFPIL